MDGVGSLGEACADLVQGFDVKNDGFRIHSGLFLGWPGRDTAQSVVLIFAVIGAGHELALVASRSGELALLRPAHAGMAGRIIILQSIPEVQLVFSFYARPCLNCTRSPVSSALLISVSPGPSRQWRGCDTG